MALAAAALLLAANIIVPIVWGDVYPFTSGPMFRDAPRACCNYRLLAADGSELRPNEWLLQRVYDGNPVGYGVGVRPPAVIEQQFGVVHEENAVQSHLQRQLATRPKSSSPAKERPVEVTQEVIGPIDAEHVGVMRIHRWRLALP